MKTYKWKFAATLFLAFVINGSSLAQEDKARPNSVELEYIPTLTVAGSGEVFAAPDRAIVRMGAQAQAEDAAAAQSTVNEAMEKALEAIKELGIPERAIRTSGINLYPVYTSQRPGSETEEPRVAGYRAANVVQVTLDNLDLIGKVVDAGVTAGVNHLEGVTFELQNDLLQRTRALERAIEEAKTKAKAMAPSLDVRLGKLREVIEGGVAIEPPQPFSGRAMRSSFSAAETPVQPGEIRVEASVTLRYEILE